MALYKISASRVNNIEAQNYAGSVVEEGLIWYDPEQGILRLYDGNVGGYIINSGGGGGGTPGGANTQIQFNNNGTFGGNAGLTFDAVTGILSAGTVAATGNISAQYFVGDGSLLTGVNTGPGTELVNGTSNIQVYPSGPVAISVNGVANVAVFEGPRAEFDSVVSQGNLTVGGDTTVKHVLPADDDVYDLGSQNKKFRSLYVGGNTIYIGTEQLKVSPDSGTWTFSSNGSNVLLGADVAFNPPAIDTPGNVTANFFIGDGSLLTGIAASLPDQTGQQGKYLSTNGTVPSWQTVAGVFGLTIDGGDADFVSTDLVIDAGGA
jgi:hypothetical protein